MKVLVIVPCYNEQDNIENTIKQLNEYAKDVDYLIVNDCSTDNSAQICKEKGFNYIDLPVNLGIGGGVQSGYLYAVQNDYDITVQMDGDGQHDPQYLQNIIKPIIDGKLDMCIGSRFIEKNGFQSSFMRRLGINILSIIIRVLTGAKIKDVTSGFRACNKPLTKYFSNNYAQDFPEPEAIIASVLNGYKVGEEAVVMKERTAGTSSINTIKSAYYMIKVSLSLIVFRLSVVRKGGKNNG